MIKILEEAYLASLGITVLTYDKAQELTRDLVKRGNLAKEREMIFITKLLESARNNTSSIIDMLNEKINYIAERDKLLKKNQDIAMGEFLDKVKTITSSSKYRFKSILRKKTDVKRAKGEIVTKSEEEEIEDILRKVNIPSHKEVEEINKILNKLIKNYN